MFINFRIFCSKLNTWASYSLFKYYQLQSSKAIYVLVHRLEYNSIRNLSEGRENFHHTFEYTRLD